MPDARVTRRVCTSIAAHLVHENFSARLATQDGADGLGDVRRRKDGEGYLVKQRLERMVIAAIDNGDVYGQFAQRLEPHADRQIQHPQ